MNPENKVKPDREGKEAAKEATVWVSGLDRIHAARNILACCDFSATPFAPSGKKNDAEALFTWIASDFGLNDGIESGLVKTPRMVVRAAIQKTPGVIVIRRFQFVPRNAPLARIVYIRGKAGAFWQWGLCSPPQTGAYRARCICPPPPGLSRKPDRPLRNRLGAPKWR
jgi:hypothetical protein